jgi:hypothetical protein
MDDYTQFLKDQMLAPSTVRNHIRNLGAYQEAGFSIDSEEDKTIEHLKTYAVGSKRQTMVSTISKYRTYKQLPNDNIRQLLVEAVKDTIKINDTNNQARDIPSISVFRRMMKDYFIKKDFASCAILYLLLTFNIRNADLMVNIVTKKPTDNTKNYLLLNPTSVVYIRNDYKTFKTYGQKKHRIVNKMFVECIQTLSTLIDKDFNNITRVIKKITGGYTEADLMKRSVFEAKGLRAYKKISDNRGTSLQVMADSYNISTQ